MIRTLSTILFLSLFFLPVHGMSAGNAGIFTRKAKKAEAPAAKTEKKETKKVKPYSEVITGDAVSRDGFFKVHRLKGKYYFEIPQSMMTRDLLVVNRISKAPADRAKSIIGYPGDPIGEEMVCFEMGPDDKVFIRSLVYVEQANDTTGMYMAVKNSNISPIIAAFDVKAYGKDSTTNEKTAVIDVTDYIMKEKNIFSFSDKYKMGRGISSLLPEMSYMDTIKVFPENIEIRTVKTFNRASGGLHAQISQMLGGGTGPLTFELNSSMILLPEKPMRYRIEDARVGYFAVGYTDFDANPVGIESRGKITRWRLEPREEDMEKYLRGELVEPKKPIIIYIDPATPKKWVPYLIAGVNDWQVAFEAAGFKNAIFGKEAPVDDPSWSLEDARHSAIVYKPSDIKNASGPHVHDPRSGEILETHINWYHNVMELLRSWYMIQAGPIDPRAQKMQFDDELMGQLIRFVSSHEVGHTLGLRHNFGSSATVPVEKLRDKEWVEANGHTPSIMDYARFNYVAQPEDSIGEKGIFPRIGMYDKWAIDWGYRLLPHFETPEDEMAYSNELIIKKLAEDPRYEFGHEMSMDDPRNQNEDLGDNSMLASAYGIKNLKRIVPNILKWGYEPVEGYRGAINLFKDVLEQYDRYVGHVLTNVGGVYSTPRSMEEPGKQFEFVPRERQKEAVDFLIKYVFETPTWLVDRELIEKIAVDPIATIEKIQSQALSKLLGKATIDKLSRSVMLEGKNAYAPEEMLRDLRRSIWSEMYAGREPDVYRRNLQKLYVNQLIGLADKKPGASSGGGSLRNLLMNFGSFSVGGPSDAAAYARAELELLAKDIRRAAATSRGVVKYNYLNMLALIDATLQMK